LQKEWLKPTSTASTGADGGGGIWYALNAWTGKGEDLHSDSVLIHLGQAPLFYVE